MENQVIFIKPQITGHVFATLLATLFAASSAYAEERTPIEEFRDGFPLELSVRAHAADLATINAGGDEQVYFARRASEFLRTRVLPERFTGTSVIYEHIKKIYVLRNPYAT